MAILKRLEQLFGANGVGEKITTEVPVASAGEHLEQRKEEYEEYWYFVARFQQLLVTHFLPWMQRNRPDMGFDAEKLLKHFLAYSKSALVIHEVRGGKLEEVSYNYPSPGDIDLYTTIEIFQLFYYFVISVPHNIHGIQHVSEQSGKKTIVHNDVEYHFSYATYIFQVSAGGVIREIELDLWGGGEYFGNIVLGNKSIGHVSIFEQITSYEIPSDGQSYLGYVLNPPMNLALYQFIEQLEVQGAGKNPGVNKNRKNTLKRMRDAGGIPPVTPSRQ